MNAELKITGRVIEIGNLDGGPVIGASFDRGDGRYFEITRLSEEEARAIAPAYDQQVTITISLAERTTSPVSQMTEDDLKQEFSLDAITRGIRYGDAYGDWERVLVEYIRVECNRALAAAAHHAQAPAAPVAEQHELMELVEVYDKAFDATRSWNRHGEALKAVYEHGKGASQQAEQPDTVERDASHLAAIEEALKVMRENGLDECYAYEEAKAALVAMKEKP